MKSRVSIGLNTFFLDQLNESKKYYPKNFSVKELIEEIKLSLLNHTFKTGYRDGVILVSISPKDWISCVVKLKPEMSFMGYFKSRVDGETPRKQFIVVFESLSEFSPAQEVDVVLYSREVLAEKDEPRTGLDWDVIGILAQPIKGGAPMSPDTLMANHFGVDGGTNTNMSSEQFEKELKISYDFWKNHAIARLREK